MKKVWAILLAITCVASVLAAQEKSAETKAKKAEKAAATKEDRWHGRIVRGNKEKSTLTVAKGNIEKTVVYNSETRWTKGTKSADQSEFTDGSDVIVLGHYDKDKNLVASRIDLRAK